MIAGIAATALEIVLWLATGTPWLATLFRDARLAAAIVLGPRVLPPEAIDAGVMLTATLLHLALSALYGAMLAPLVARLQPASALGAGALCGLALYAINMYGFTGLFPWFEATRDAVTVAAHVAFGAITAGAYRWLSR